MPFFPNQKWLVRFGGGEGPDVWDDEKIVTGSTLREALDSIEGQVKDAGGDVIEVSIAP